MFNKLPHLATYLTTKQVFAGGNIRAKLVKEFVDKCFESGADFNDNKDLHEHLLSGPWLLCVYIYI